MPMRRPLPLHLKTLSRDLLRDKAGATAIAIGLGLTGFVGFVSLGSEVGLWYYTHRTMQSAADSAALSGAAALAAAANGDYTGEAKLTTAQYGFVDGTSGVSVTINKPPASGNYTSNANAVEVIVQQPQTALLSALFLAAGPTIAARAVALQGNPGTGCVLALDNKASAATFGNGTTNVNLVGCSLYVNSTSSSALDIVGSATISADTANIVGNLADSGNASITTVHGLHTGVSPASDPYANVGMPTFSGCDQSGFSASKNGSTISPGVYCGGFKANANTSVTLNPGTYIIDGGSLAIAGGATVSGTGVTIVLTNSSGSNPATVAIHGGADVNLTAPTSGPLAGIALMQDRNGTPGTINDFSGGTTQNILGAIYFPTETVTFAGGTQTGTGCMQIVADEIDFKGNANLEINCTGKGTKTIGSGTAKLVE